MARSTSITGPPRRSHGAMRAGDLLTKRDVLRASLAHGSPRVIVAATSMALVARLLVASWSLTDLLVAGVTIALIGPAEAVIHRGFLHAGDESFAMRRLGTGHGHRRHHLDPPDVHWLLMRRIDAALYAAAIAVFTALWTLPLAWMMGVSPAGTFLSAVTIALAALGHYEWTHLLVHARYRPRSRRYARLARHHRLHHFRNERYWLGITSTIGDRLLGTLPADRADVPLSETARRLR